MTPFPYCAYIANDSISLLQKKNSDTLSTFIDRSVFALASGRSPSDQVCRLQPHEVPCRGCHSRRVVTDLSLSQFSPSTETRSAYKFVPPNFILERCSLADAMQRSILSQAIRPSVSLSVRHTLALLLNEFGLRGLHHRIAPSL